MGIDTLEKQLADPETFLQRTAYTLGVELPSASTTKGRIVGLLKSIGIESDHPLISAVQVVDVGNKTGMDELLGRIAQSLDRGSRVAIRVTDLEKDVKKGGGLLTVEISSPGQIQDSISSSGLSITTLEGDTVVIPAVGERRAEIFSRHPSVSGIVRGLTGVDRPVKTAWGGGFRLALDRIIPKDGSNNEAAILELVCDFGFGDRSPRSLNDPGLPHLLTNLSLPLMEGGLTLPKGIYPKYKESFERLVESRQGVKKSPFEASAIVEVVQMDLVHRYYERITRALIASHVAFPLSRAAQIEGIWSIQTDSRVVGEVSPNSVITDLEGGWSLASTRRNPIMGSLNEFSVASAIVRTSKLDKVYPLEVSKRMIDMASWSEFANTLASFKDSKD